MVAQDDSGSNNLVLAAMGVGVLLVMLLGMVGFLMRMQKQDEHEEVRREKAKKKEPKQRGAMARMARGGGRAGAGSGSDVEDEEGDEDGDDGVDGALAGKKGKSARRDEKKSEKKDDKKAQKQADQQAREQKEKSASDKKQKYNKKLEEKEAIRLKKEQEDQERQEAQEKKDQDEFDQWKNMFSVDAEGQEEVGDASAGMLARFVSYIETRKVVLLEELAAEFGLKTSDAIERIRSLEASKRLSGVFDDRGKFIFIAPEEMDAVAHWLNKKGRVNRADLVAACNRLVRLNPTAEDRVRIAKEDNKAVEALESALSAEEGTPGAEA